MTLGELTLWLLIGLTAFQFWRIRSISEKANAYARQYCDQHQLQLLSVARQKTRLSGRHGKLDWYSEFTFEFSGNGEDRYSGQIYFIGKQVIKTSLPPYRVN